MRNMSKLKAIKVAILITDGFEQSEMVEPKTALEKEQATVHIISPKKNNEKVKGWIGGNWAEEFSIDLSLDSANPDDYDGLVLPGGVINPDKLRIDKNAIAFIKHFIKAKKPIAAICHGPWTLINAEGVKGKTMTSWASLEKDLENAGAKWVDKEVVRDGHLITSRKPADLKAFCGEMIKLLLEKI